MQEPPVPESGGRQITSGYIFQIRVSVKFTIGN
jgi:hypothetical protein